MLRLEHDTRAGKSISVLNEKSQGFCKYSCLPSFRAIFSIINMFESSYFSPLHAQHRLLRAPAFKLVTLLYYCRYRHFLLRGAMLHGNQLSLTMLRGICFWEYTLLRLWRVLINV